MNHWNFKSIPIIKKISTLPLSILMLLLIFQSGSAQLVSVPDPNLLDKLKKTVPDAIKGNMLDTILAASYTTPLDLSFANISDATGVQYFNQISLLNLNNNNLVTTPDLSSFKNLVSLYLNDNKLTSIPNLNTQKGLIDLQIKNNQLDYLPTLSNLTNLFIFRCTGNKLSNFPDISGATNLVILEAGYNPFHTIPDLSGFRKLVSLHVHKTNIKSLTGLNNLPNLEELFAWGNDLEDLSTLNSNTKLRILQIFDNRLKNLPVLTNKTNLSNASFINNYLTFEDLLQIKAHPNSKFFDYTPQKEGVDDGGYSNEGNNYWVVFPEDGSVTDNTYQWYKNGEIVPNATSPTYPVNNVSVRDSGIYQLKIKNPQFPGMVLSWKTSLNVIPCITVTDFEVATLQQDCQTGTDIQLSFTSNAQPPFSYRLIDADSDIVATNATGYFKNLKAGNATVILTDGKGCKSEKTIVVERAVDCPSVISPNDDGIMDEYYINESGKIRIFDKNKVLVRELSGPAAWNGTTSNGEIAGSGLYFIVVNDTKLMHITIIR